MLLLLFLIFSVLAANPGYVLVFGESGLNQQSALGEAYRFAMNNGSTIKGVPSCVPFRLMPLPGRDSSLIFIQYRSSSTAFLKTIFSNAHITPSGSFFY